MHKKMRICRQAWYAMAVFLCTGITPALADLPQIEPPTSGGGGGLFGQIKGYLQDGVVLFGLVLSAVAFVKVAEAAFPPSQRFVTGRPDGGSLVPSWWLVLFCWSPLSGCWASRPPSFCKETSPCRPFVFCPIV